MGKLLIRCWRLFCNAKNGAPVSGAKLVRKTEPQKDEQADALIFQLPDDQLMQKPTGTVAMPGSEEREFINLSDLQKQIIETRTFDLLEKRITPTSASISERQISDDLVSIDLGKVNVQSQNQILLENVDPKRIPEDLDIVFKGDKRIVLVGRLQQQNREKTQGGSEMAVANNTFEELSMEEYRRKYLGLRMDSFSFDWREFLRSLILAMPTVFVIMPFIYTYVEYRKCANSIQEIQQAELRSLEKTKKNYLSRTLLDNPNFNS